MRTRLRRTRAAPFVAGACFGFLALLLSSGPAAAADSPFGHPVYNPHTKSYFELRDDNTDGKIRDGVWQAAHAHAASLSYKGARGRLAIVADLETHEFLNRNFRIDNATWIGLRYWCTFRKLTWSDGSIHEPAAFSAWAQSWHRMDLPPCTAAGTAQTGYMSVYYLPTPGGMRWQAVGSSKGFRRYFVEYPTGHP